MATWTLDATDRFEMLAITYERSRGCARLDFCDLFGIEPLQPVIVVGGIATAPATQEGLDLGPGCQIEPCGEELAIRLAESEVPDSVGEAVAVLLDTGEDQFVSGFQFGLAHDAGSVAVAGIEEGSALQAIGGVDFWGVNILPDEGATVGCVIDLEPEPDDSWRTLAPCRPDQEIAVVRYTCSSIGGNETATIRLSGELGDPEVRIVVDVDGGSLVPRVGESMTITVPCPGIPFMRGDANQNGFLEPGDALAIMKAVFGLGAKYSLIENCMDSADVDDNGSIAPADAIYMLEYEFLEGPMIPPPHRTCGADPTEDGLSCVEFACP